MANDQSTEATVPAPEAPAGDAAQEARITGLREAGAQAAQVAPTADVAAASLQAAEAGIHAIEIGQGPTGTAQEAQAVLDSAAAGAPAAEEKDKIAA